MSRLLVIFTCLALSIFRPAAAAAAPADHGVLWKLKTTSAWPPALIGPRLILKQGDTLTAHAMNSGKVLWSTKIPDPIYGKGALAASNDIIYVLSRAGVRLIHPHQGRLLKVIPLSQPRTVLHASGSIYVSSEQGIQRYDDRGQKLLQSAPGVIDELQGADGNHVAVYRRVSGQNPRVSPKRLTVIDLRTGKQVYEFKLLAKGAHQLARIKGGKISFIDFSRALGKGKNAKKLFYTEADYQSAKKLKDISLSRYYTQARAEAFWITTDESGTLYLGNHGPPGVASTLLAFDPRRRKTIWSHTGDAVAMGILLQRGKLWTGTAGKDQQAHLTVYDAATGKVSFQVPLDSPGTGTPVAAGQRVLLRTRDSLYCFAPRAALVPRPPVTTSASPRQNGTAGRNPVRPGWRLMRDRAAGYLIQTPTSWSVDRSKIRKLGGVRFVIPFSRKGPGTDLTSIPRPLATIQIMTWEAAGRDAKAVWRSVLAQRKKLSKKVRVSRVHRIKDVGQTGSEGLLAIYNFTNHQGYPAQLRSLCVVHHGVAFEVRAWVGPRQRKLLWREIRDILMTFHPKTF